MSDFTELRSSLKTIRGESLPSLGINDCTVRRVISARLLIERLGESDANYWWDSRVLSSFGKETLKDTVPQTATQSQIHLAMKIGRKAEREVINGPSISLFDLGPSLESKIQRELEDIHGKQDLAALEECSLELTETGWTRDLFDENINIKTNSGKTHEIGTTEMKNIETKEALDDIVTQLIGGYGTSTKSDLRVPYYRIDQ